MARLCDRDRIRSLMQRIGTALSYRLFTDRVLAHAAGKDAYLACYFLFKRLFGDTELRALYPYIRPGGTVLDIGAHVGSTALSLAEAVGPTGTVIAFEPDPISADLFRRAIEKSMARNITLHPFALGAHDGSATLFHNPSNRADNRLVMDPTMSPRAEPVRVQVRMLSSLAAEEPDLFSNISAIKLDVQGYEMRVIEGMADWVRGLERKPLLHMELWPYGLRQARTSVRDLLALLADLGYDIGPDLCERAERMDMEDGYIDVTLLPR